MQNHESFLLDLIRWQKHSKIKTMYLNEQYRHTLGVESFVVNLYQAFGVPETTRGMYTTRRTTYQNPVKFIISATTKHQWQQHSGRHT